jgi:hypothetical protein
MVVTTTNAGEDVVQIHNGVLQGIMAWDLKINGCSWRKSY